MSPGVVSGMFTRVLSGRCARPGVVDASRLPRTSHNAKFSMQSTLMAPRRSTRAGPFDRWTFTSSRLQTPSCWRFSDRVSMVLGPEANGHRFLQVNVSNFGSYYISQPISGMCCPMMAVKTRNNDEMPFLAYRLCNHPWTHVLRCLFQQPICSE